MRKTGNGALHGQHGRVQNIQLVDLMRLRATEAPAQRFFFDLIEQRQATLFA
jgi:hypothetical protein